MRSTLTALLLCLTAAIPAAASSEPETADTAAARPLADYVARLFELTPPEQQAVRERLEAEVELPQMLSTLLGHEDPAVRQTSLALIRDDYGDPAVVDGVQSLLADQLARSDGGNPAVISACCEILADWPNWNSIPLLLDVLRTEPSPEPTDVQVVHRPLPLPNAAGHWREADLALRAVSGTWPLPEPPALGDTATSKTAPGHGAFTQLGLLKSWIDWWSQTNLAKPVSPQLRIDLSWSRPGSQGDSERDPRYRFDATHLSLWVRPTAGAQLCCQRGWSREGDDPAWRWANRRRDVEERPMNAIQADAVRVVRESLAAAPPVAPWTVPTVEGVGEDFVGTLEMTHPISGETVSVELVPAGDPSATCPPQAVSEALAEVLMLMARPTGDDDSAADHH